MTAQQYQQMAHQACELLKKQLAKKVMYDITYESLEKTIRGLFYGKCDTDRPIKIWPMGPAAQKALSDAIREEGRRYLSELKTST